jgi:hypothetical protein
LKISDLFFHFVVQFSVDPGALSFNLRVSHNLLIGNVPLRSSFANFQQRIVDLTKQTQTDNTSNITTLGDGIASLIFTDYPDLRKYHLWLLYKSINSALIIRLFLISNKAPPSYEECMFGGDIREAGDSEHVTYYGVGESYKPRYLTYG